MKHVDCEATGLPVHQFLWSMGENSHYLRINKTRVVSLLTIKSYQLDAWKIKVLQIKSLTYRNGSKSYVVLSLSVTKFPVNFDKNSLNFANQW